MSFDNKRGDKGTNNILTTKKEYKMKHIDRQELCRLAFIGLKRDGKNEAALELASQLLSGQSCIIMENDTIGDDIKGAMKHFVGACFFGYCSTVGTDKYKSHVSFDLRGKDIEIPDARYLIIINEILYNKK